MFAVDALTSSHPLSSEEDSIILPEQISEQFDAISYSKVHRYQQVQHKHTYIVTACSRGQKMQKTDISATEEVLITTIHYCIYCSHFNAYVLIDFDADVLIDLEIDLTVCLWLLRVQQC